MEADLEARRSKKCLSSNIHGAVGAVSSSVLSDRVVGEADVAVSTDAIQMSSTRLSTSGGGGGLSPPGDSRRALSGDAGCPGPSFVLPPSIFASASEEDERNGVGAQTVGWRVNPFEFDSGSAALDSDVSSLTLTSPSDALSEPVVIMLPRSGARHDESPAACESDSECTSPSGFCALQPQSGVLCAGPDDPCSAVGMVSARNCTGAAATCVPLTNETGTMPNITGLCECQPGYQGARCQEQVECRYWDFLQERWSTDGCSVSPNSSSSCTICECTHLTDFASAAEEWIPPLNLVNPFEVDLLGAFTADPRNIVVLALILSIYVRVMLSLSILRALAQANNQQRTTITGRLGLLLREGLQDGRKRETPALVRATFDPLCLRLADQRRIAIQHGYGRPKNAAARRGPLAGPSLPRPES